jgi:hypothetical protein
MNLACSPCRRSLLASGRPLVNVSSRNFPSSPRLLAAPASSEVAHLKRNWPVTYFSDEVQSCLAPEDGTIRIQYEEWRKDGPVCWLLYAFALRQRGSRYTRSCGLRQRICILTTIIVSSHNHVRSKAGLFDVGHMVQSLYVCTTRLEVASLLGY